MSWRAAATWRDQGAPPLTTALARTRGVGLRGALTERRARSWASRVLRARAGWTSDFGGEQFALGRAFYTHLETGSSAAYFRDVAASDARVEAALPAAVRDELAVLGHRLVVQPDHGAGGSAQLISVDERGVLSGAADPRQEGVALGVD